jgi:hypothetical protein
MTIRTKIGPLLVLLAAVACGGAADLGTAADGGATGDAGLDAGNPTDAGTADAGTLDGGTATADPGTDGGLTIPPPTTDGASQVLANGSSTVGGTNIDFGFLQGMAQGGIVIGSSRTAEELVYNNSKKVDLSINSVTIIGANAGDFSLAAVDVNTATTVPIQANKSASHPLHVTFTPTVAGTRTASLQVISNAGTATASLTGMGLEARPILGPIAALVFTPGSAFQTIQVIDQGGEPLVLQSLTIIGTNATSFQIVPANDGFSNCSNGFELSPLSHCFLGIGLAPDAAAPASATLRIVSNDPASPADISLSLTP